MLIKDDIDYLRQVIREEVEAEGKRIYSNVTLLKAEVKAGMLQLANRMKDLEISNKRLEEGQQRIEKKLEKEITGNAEALQDIMQELTRLDDQETRIKRLEDDNTFLPH